MSLDDRHVYDKHNQIYPSKSELDAFEKIVGVTEKVLKKLSDKFVNEDYPITSPKPNKIWAVETVQARLLKWSQTKCKLKKVQVTSLLQQNWNKNQKFKCKYLHTF